MCPAIALACSGSQTFPALRHTQTAGELSLGFRLEMMLVRARCTNLRALSVFCIAFPINAPTGNRVRDGDTSRYCEATDWRTGLLWRGEQANKAFGFMDRHPDRVVRRHAACGNTRLCPVPPACKERRLPAFPFAYPLPVRLPASRSKSRMCSASSFCSLCSPKMTMSFSWRVLGFTSKFLSTIELG